MKLRALFIVLLLLFALPLCAGVSVQNSDYHGLKAITLKNASAQVVIVPAAGRIMSFQLCQHDKCGENPIWNNPQLGSSLKADDEGWTNYGGDKSWPAPQSDWPKITGKGWPPPTGFDHMPFTAKVKNGTVTLTSPVDPSYGIRVRRVISLEPSKPILHVSTIYEKVQGDPVNVSVWTITQLNSPERGYILLPEREKIPGGFTRPPHDSPNSPYPFEKVSIDGRLLSFTRDPQTKRKMGTDGDRLLWLGKAQTLLIEQTTARTSGEQYPDDSHSQIYTNPDELPYVEFELFAPLQNMKPGSSTALKATYSLSLRKSQDDKTEAQRILEVVPKGTTISAE
jgi:hypothetical protein